jgi:signal transduction histidine kinase
MTKISNVPAFHSHERHASSTFVATMFADGYDPVEILAHEFGNLLMPILGYAEMAADNLKSGTSARRYMECILAAGDRAKFAVEQFLARDKTDFTSVFDVVAATAEILPDLSMYLPSTSRLHVDLPDRPLWLDGSAISLQQVIVNLCKNAGEAMKDGGTVKLTVGDFKPSKSSLARCGRLDHSRYVRVSLSDTGPGIPRSILKRVFDPYFTTKSDQVGHGLGLALVHRVVESWGGVIDVNSIPGQGTAIDLFLPCLGFSKPTTSDRPS